METSSVKCFSEVNYNLFLLSDCKAFSDISIFPQTANKRNKLTFIAEPLDDGLAEKLEAGKVNLNWENRKVR